MQIAFLSDIHGNLAALEAVLEDIDRCGIDTVVCLGDVIGYGPDPAECVRLVSERCLVTVLGNHEAMLLFASRKALSAMPDRVTEPLWLAERQLSEAAMKWLRELPLVALMDPITAVHSRLDDPARFDYIFSQRDARKNFAAQETFISVHGHSHVPVIWEKRGATVQCRGSHEEPVLLDEDSYYAINVGSVGQPRDGNPEACYLIYDHDSAVICHRRIPYDIDITQRRIREEGLSDHNAERIALGH